MDLLPPRLLDLIGENDVFDTSCTFQFTIVKRRDSGSKDPDKLTCLPEATLDI